MFKDSFTLKKDSWHASLMKYIWNFYTSDFSHICPYFWLSILNIFIALPVFLFKSTFNKLLAFFNKLGRKARERRWLREEEKSRVERLEGQVIRENIKNDPEFRENFWKQVMLEEDNCKLSSSYWEIYYDIVREFNWYDEDTIKKREDIATSWDVWKKYLAESEAKRKDKRVRKFAEQQKHILKVQTRKEKIGKMMRYVKPTSTFLVMLLGTAALLALVAGLVYIISKVTAHAWINILVIIAGLAAFAGVVILLFYIIRAICNLGIKIHIGCSTKKRILSVLKAIAQPFVWFFKGLGTFFSILLQIIKSNCPAIVWKD